MSNPPPPEQPPSVPPSVPPVAPVAQPAVPAQPAAPLTAAEDTQWASFAHFGGALIVFALLQGFLGLFVLSPVGQAITALLAIAPALVIFLVFGKRGPRTLVESKEALNFQITAVAALIVWIIISTAIFWGIVYNVYLGSEFAYYALFAGLGLPTLAIAGLDILFSILGGMKVRAGGSYRYPFAIRLIK